MPLSPTINTPTSDPKYTFRLYWAKRNMVNIMVHSPIQIAVVAFEGISAFQLAVPGVVFRESRHGQPHFALTVCSAEGTKLNTSAGYAIEIQATLALLDHADIVVIPSWRNPDETPPTALLDALKRAHQRGAMIVGLCLGAYVVAETGLLDGKHATTHWEYGDHFAKRFPKVQLNADVLYLQRSVLLHPQEPQQAWIVAYISYVNWRAPRWQTASPAAW